MSRKSSFKFSGSGSVHGNSSLLWSGGKSIIREVQIVKLYEYSNIASLRAELHAQLFIVISSLDVVNIICPVIVHTVAILSDTH